MNDSTSRTAPRVGFEEAKPSRGALMQAFCKAAYTSQKPLDARAKF